MDDIDPKTGLTWDEVPVYYALIEAAEAFSHLEVQHPQELGDFCDGIHRCQELLTIRIARRGFPLGWPTKP